MEVVAANAVAHVLGGTWQQHDTGVEPLQHDADVAIPGLTIALEVTSTTEARDVAMWRRISQTEWEFGQLTSSWTLNVLTGTNINRLRQGVVAALRELEAAGLDRYGSERDEVINTGREAVRALRDLGVRRAAKFADNEKPGFVVLASSRGGATSPELVREAVEREASKSDNLRKLARASVDERHLWVWIQAEPAASAMAFDRLPENAPGLPPEVDVVWASLGYRDDDDRIVVRRLWRAMSGQRWEGLSPSMGQLL